MRPIRNHPGFTWSILFAVVALVISIAGCENGNLGVRGGSMGGVVRDSRTLVGLAGVAVEAISGTGQDDQVSAFTQTDSQGSFVLTDLRPGQWKLGFAKPGYATVTTAGSGTSAIGTVITNNQHVNLPDVYLVPNYFNQFITVRGILKDAINGTLITLGTANFIFDNISFMNRLPTEIQTGFSVPAHNGPINLQVTVSNYYVGSGTVVDGRVDQDLGTILMYPRTYSIVGVFRDVPGWVYTKNPAARVFAYAGRRLLSTVDVSMNAQSFTLRNIPVGQEVSLTIQFPGYRMNGPILVNPNSDFEGTIYQDISLKSHFSPILRDVTVVIAGGTNMDAGERVGAYCEETGTRWPETILTNPPGTVGTPRVITLGTLQMPTGYEFTFRGYNVDDGSQASTKVLINDDGVDPQIVTITVS